MDRDIFLERAKKIHNNKYEYKETNSYAIRDYIDIICPIHGEFRQQISSHIHDKRGCRRCRNDGVRNRFVDTENEFWEKVKLAHGDNYELRGKYINAKTKIKIFCKKHDYEFEILPCNLKKGRRCKFCAKESFIKNRSNSVEKFIEEAHKKHGINRYDYSMVNHSHSHEYVSIKCNTCGETFNQLAYSHINNGNGCPKCKVSKQEREIQLFIKEELKIDSALFSDRTVLVKKELDVYIPDLNIAIEHDGTYRHSEISGQKDRNYHIQKTKECNDKNIQLIHIFENEWKLKNEICKSMLRCKLNKIENKIYARKCIIKSVDIKESQLFLNENHIQGNCNSALKLGLYHNNKLVSIMTFGVPRYNKDYQWEIVRFCNILDTQIIGGASKLFTYFIKSFKPKSVISYADKRWSNGNLYKNLGFSHSWDSSPRYWYIPKENYLKLFHRSKFTLKNIKKLFKCDIDNKSEWELMQENGYDRIWDCGQKVYTLHLG